MPQPPPLLRLPPLPPPPTPPLPPALRLGTSRAPQRAARCRRRRGRRFWARDAAACAPPSRSSRAAARPRRSAPAQAPP
ncbi:Protein of unknown function, partial [Gryllus bimaculatus]